MKYFVFLALLISPARQDAGAVVDAVDAKLGDFKDATCTITTADLRWFINVVPDGPARLRISRDGDAQLDCRMRDSTMFDATVDYSMKVTKEGFHYEVTPIWTDLLRAGQPMCIRARAPLDGLQGCDPLLLPTFYPVRLFMDDSLLLYALAPKRYFGLEKELTLLEKRADGTTVLLSRTMVKDPIKALGIPFVVAAPIEKRFLIKDGRLDRVSMRIDLGRSGYGAMMVSQVVGRDDGGRPTKVQLRLTTLFQGRVQRFDPVERTIVYESINKGILVTTPRDTDVAWADAALKPYSAYAKKDDATSLASGVAHRLWIRKMIRSIFQVALGEPEEEKAVEGLEKLRELRPKDLAVALNLVALYRQGDKAKELLQKAGLDAPAWKALRVAVLEETPAEQRLQELAAAAGVELSTLTTAQWTKVAQVFSAEQLATWASKSPSPPARLLLWLSWDGAKDADKSSRLLARAIELEPKDADVREHAIDATLSCYVKEQLPEGFAKLAEKLNDPVLLLWKLLHEDRKDEARAKAKSIAVASLAQHRGFALALARLDDLDGAVKFTREHSNLSVEKGALYVGPDSPLAAVARLALERKNPAAFAEAFEPMMKRYSWGAANALVGRVEEFKAQAPKWAADHAAEGARVALLARVLYSATYQESEAIDLLETALAKSETKEVALQLAAWTKDEGRARDLYKKGLAAGAPADVINRAVWVAARSGHSELSREFLKLLPSMLDAFEVGDAAQAAMQAGDYDQAMNFARALEDHARHPFVLYGKICEARKAFEEAVRWYNRDAKETGDALEQYVGLPYDAGIWGTGRGKVTASDAKKKLLAALGEDYFFKKLLDAKAPALSADDETKAKQAFTALTAEDLSERDSAEESLLKLGRGAVPILKAGLDSTDSDVKERVTRILRRLAEP